MREVLAKALSGPINLDEQAHERPVDRLHALASSQIERANANRRGSFLASLGVSLIALRDSNRPDEYARAIEKLAKFMEEVRPRTTLQMRLRISRQAVQENIISFCPRCKGAREVPASKGIDGAQRMMPCPPPDDPVSPGCGGTGKRRYSDAERIEAVGVQPSESANVNAQIAYAHLVLAQAESEAVRMAKKLLERW